jgi:hypothetical protein
MTRWPGRRAFTGRGIGRGRSSTCGANRERFEEDPESNENPEDVEATSKVGGYPGWLQSADVPACGVCEKEMVFVPQIGELDQNLNFAGGDSYVFRCAEEHEAKLIWPAQ